MKRKTGWISLGCALILIVAAGIGGFFLGKNRESGRFMAEKEFMIRLNRSELEGLGDISERIYVTGHKSPDSDTVGSSIGYAALLRALGYDAAAVLLGPVNRESAIILETAGLEMPEILPDAAGRTMVLVDHSEYAQSADGLEDAKIIGIIDHHGDGSVLTANPLIYDARPLGSTAAIVWMKYLDYGIEPDQQTAIMMLGSVLSDTSNLRSASTTFADREAVRALSALSGISDTDAFYREMYRESLSYEGNTDEEIYLSDYKEYDIGGFKVSVGSVNAYDEAAAKELAERMKKIMPQMKLSAGMDLSFAMVSIKRDDLSATWLVPAEEEEEAVLAAASWGQADVDGTSYIIRPSMSRKADFIPGITEVLNSAWKE